MEIYIWEGINVGNFSQRVNNKDLFIGLYISLLSTVLNPEHMLLQGFLNDLVICVL